MPSKHFRRGVQTVALLAGIAAVPFMLATALAAQQSSPDPFATLATVDDASLRTMHGRGGNISYNIQGQNNLDASINGSTITAGGDITNGALTISGDAMQNFQGLSNFVANTGSNNNLQAAMVVNITLH